MSRALALTALIVALASAGCDRLLTPEEDLQPAGLRLQPVPGAAVEPDESFRLPPAAPSNPVENP
jgi:hypothetical protein